MISHTLHPPRDISHVRAHLEGPLSKILCRLGVKLQGYGNEWQREREEAGRDGNDGMGRGKQAGGGVRANNVFGGDYA